MNVNTQGSKAIILAMLVVVGVSATAFLYILNSSENQTNTPNTSGIESLRILGNSSDLIYPELMEAYFYQEINEWLVSASFLDDSEGWENPELYERTFSVSDENVTAIDDVLKDSLSQTHASEDQVLSILDLNPHVGFGIEIIYTDGSWIYLCTFQTEKGHIIKKIGSGTLDTNLLDGTLLEPVAALEGLVTIIRAVISSNMS